jgi:hypothetical protein
MSETSLLAVRCLSIYTYYGCVLLFSEASGQSVYLCNYERKKGRTRKSVDTMMILTATNLFSRREPCFFPFLIFLGSIDWGLLFRRLGVWLWILGNSNVERLILEDL